MRQTLLVLLLSCSNEPGPHDRVLCEDTSWSVSGQSVSVMYCERACTREPTYQDTAFYCEFAIAENGDTGAAQGYFLAPDGTRGWCDFKRPVNLSRAEIVFRECLDQGR